METTTFRGIKCYIAYKGLKNDLSNYQGNYTYELNKWYSALNVDLLDVECSFGLNLTKDPVNAFDFGSRVFKCYVPVDKNVIKFHEGSDKFRVKIFYLSDEEFDCEKYWNELTENQKNSICMANGLI